MVDGEWNRHLVIWAMPTHVLSASAQTYRQPKQRPRATGNVLSGVAFLAASAAHGGQGAVAQAAMVQSMLRLAQAIHRSAAAAKDARQARAIAADVRARLTRVHEGLRTLSQAQAGRACRTDHREAAGRRDSGDA